MKLARWFKRVVLVLSLLLALGMILCGLAWQRIFTRPAFYQPYAWNEKQREQVNQQVVDKLVLIHNLAAAAGTVRQSRLNPEPRTLNPPLAPLTVTFSESELNAFIQHNAEMQAVRRQFEQYILDPAIFFWDGQIILSAQAKEFGFVASVYLKPALDAQGKLHLDLTRTMAGRLVVPRFIANTQYNRLRKSIGQQLPACQNRAKIDDAGRANSSAVMAALLKMVLNAMDQKPTDPAIFVPLGDDGAAVPLAVSRLAIDGDTLSVTLRPMSAAEREGLMASVARASRP